MNKNTTYLFLSYQRLLQIQQQKLFKKRNSHHAFHYHQSCGSSVQVPHELLLASTLLALRHLVVPRLRFLSCHMRKLKGQPLANVQMASLLHLSLLLVPVLGVHCTCLHFFHLVVRWVFLIVALLRIIILNLLFTCCKEEKLVFWSISHDQNILYYDSNWRSNINDEERTNLGSKFKKEITWWWHYLSDSLSCEGKWKQWCWNLWVIQ